MKILSVFLFLTSSFVAYSQDSSLTKELIGQRLHLKNYAFCSCVYNLDSTKKQEIINDGSKAGYFEISDYELEAYHLIDTLAKKYALKKYSSISNKTLGLMKCLDFYNSRELANKIKSLDGLMIKHK